jgi:hypothetical protein
MWNYKFDHGDGRSIEVRGEPEVDLGQFSTPSEMLEHLRGLAYSRQKEPIRPLEEYLRALWRLAAARRNEPPDCHGIFALFRDAFTAEAAPFDDAWDRIEDEGPRLLDWDEREGHSIPGAGAAEAAFDAFAQVLHFHVADLRRFAKAGKLDDPRAYFGIDSLRDGGRWYNFDPVGYLECGAAGVAAKGLSDGKLAEAGWQLPALILLMGRYYE